MSGEISPTPWGDLEVYEYNGKYCKHRNSIPASEKVDVEKLQSVTFDPWQVGATGDHSVAHDSQILPLSVEPTLVAKAP